MEVDFGFWTKFLEERSKHRMITRVSAFESLQPEVTLKYLFDGHTTSPFFGPKISVFGQKIRFLPYDPNFR